MLKIGKNWGKTANYLPQCSTKIGTPGCNCNYILFTKLPWPEDSEWAFWSLSQAATCPHVYYTRWKLHAYPLIVERQAGKLGLTRPRIEPESTMSVTDTLSTGPQNYNNINAELYKVKVTQKMRGSRKGPHFCLRAFCGGAFILFVYITVILNSFSRHFQKLIPIYSIWLLTTTWLCSNLSTISRCRMPIFWFLLDSLYTLNTAV